MTRAEDGLSVAGELVDKALGAGAEHAQAEHIESDTFEVSFDTGEVSLVRSAANEGAYLTVLGGHRKGSATFTGLSRASVEQALRSALDAMASSLPDEANALAECPSLPPAEHGHRRPETEAMLDCVLAHLELMKAHYAPVLERSSSYSFSYRRRSFVNSNGVAQQEGRGSYKVALMFAAKRGAEVTSFNYGGAASFEPFPRLLDAGGLERLLEEALRSTKPRPIPEKFVGETLLSPQCAATLLSHVADALSGYALFSKTTPYLHSMGRPIASAGFGLSNRPRSSAFPGGADFDGFGVPTRDLDVIVDGVLEAFLVDYPMARKLGVPQTAGRHNLCVAPGETSLDELVAGTERGILLSRFSGGAPNENLELSGVAKNSFYVEDGQIGFPLIETMVSGSLVRLLENVRGVSSEHINFGNGCFPYIAASGMTLSSK